MIDLYKEYCRSYNLTDENSDGYFDTVRDIYFSDEVQSLAQYEQHLDINRLQHITSVSFLAYKISRKYGLDFIKTTRAAVMHDLFYYDWRDGITGKWHRLHGYKHPRYAVMNARELYPAISRKEEEIIKCHMWPLTILPPKSAEGFVVSFCDKYCAAAEVLYSVNKSFKNKFLKDIVVNND